MHEMRTFCRGAPPNQSGHRAETILLLLPKVARASGGSVAGHAPAGLLASVPVEFKTLGLDTHGKFDQIAESAEKNFDPKHTSKQVTKLLGNCVACHKMYRMDVK